MTDCSRLQALLDGAKQQRQALDDPRVNAILIEALPHMKCACLQSLSL